MHSLAPIDLGDVRLHCKAYGAGPALLLLHGLGSSGDDWAFQVGDWSQRHRLLVPDLRGCGRSEVTAGAYSVELFASDMWRLLDAIGESQVALVGFSMGGAVALEMALQRPAAVSHLVTINSLPSYRIDHWRKALELYLQIGMVRLLGLRRTAGMIGRRLFPQPHQRAMRERVVEVIGNSDVQPYLRCARALADWCAAERIGELRCRTLMIAGEFDYTPLAEKRRWAERLGARLAVIGDSRHGTPFDAIGATNACVSAFLAGKPLPDAAQLRTDGAQHTPSEPPPLPPARSPLPSAPLAAGARLSGTAA